MKVAIGCDHAGYPLKMAVEDKLLKDGYEIIDLGTDSTEPVDYLGFGKPVAEALARGLAEKGIIICGPG